MTIPPPAALNPCRWSLAEAALAAKTPGLTEPGRGRWADAAERQRKAAVLCGKGFISTQPAQTGPPRPREVGSVGARGQGGGRPHPSTVRLPRGCDPSPVSPRPVVERLVPALPACYLTVLGADLLFAGLGQPRSQRGPRWDGGGCVAAGRVQGAPLDPSVCRGGGDGCGTWLCHLSVCPSGVWLWLDPGVSPGLRRWLPHSPSWWLPKADGGRWGQRHVSPSPRPSHRPSVEGRAGRGADQLERIRIRQLR